MMSMLAAPAGTAAVSSGWCDLEDLCLTCDLDGASTALRLDAGWTKRWTATWKVSGSDVVCPVRDLASMPSAVCQPVRRFSWRTGQRHRPGLQYVVSTGRHHGFESIAEQRVLLGLDFASNVREVVSQPFRLRFATRSGWRSHIPDFLAVTATGGLLIDVRPADRVGADDRVAFAAAAESALACGWRYVVVTGWRPQVLAVLGTLSAQRRDMADPLGLRERLLSVAASGPLPFGDLVAATQFPAIARAHAVHLIWRRALSIDLAAPFTDQSLVCPTSVMSSA